MPREFIATPQDELVIETDEVVAAIEGRTALQLVDARDAVRFRGEKEPIDTVAGHIPGALNLPSWAPSLALFLLIIGLPIVLATAVIQGGASRRPAPSPLGVMCGSGVTACHLVLSSAIAGLAEPRVYVGSWSEWIRDPRRGVATGEG